MSEWTEADRAKLKLLQRRVIESWRKMLSQGVWRTAISAAEWIASWITFAAALVYPVVRIRDLQLDRWLRFVGAVFLASLLFGFIIGVLQWAKAKRRLTHVLDEKEGTDTHSDAREDED